MAGTTTTFPGAPGPAGPQGPEGPQGPPGPAGDSVWTQTGTVLSPTTSGDTVEVPVAAFATVAISTSEPSGFTASIAPGQIIASDGLVLEARLDAAGALMALRGDSGGAVVPTIRARDFDDTATTLDLVVGGLTVNSAAGSAGEVLTSNGAGSAPTWQAPAAGGIGGTIAAGQVAFGSGVDTIAGDSRLQYSVAQNTLTLDAGIGNNGIIVQDTVSSGVSDVQSGQVVLMGGGGISGATLSGLSGYLRLEADVGGAGDIPTIQAWDESDNPTTLELTVGGLTVNNSAGTAGQVLTSAGAGAAPTWETPSTGSSTVVGLTDRYEELPSQTFSEFAHGGLVAASPTRDIQTAIDATPVGPACQVIVGPGSYSGATVTIPTGRNNIAIIGPTAGDFGGTVVSLSAGRALTIGNNAVRVRVANIQIEGLTTISTTGAGVHRIERCQLVGGLSVGAISATIYVVGCEVGAVTINAGFTGLVLFDRCLFTSTYTNSALPTRVAMSDSAGLASAPTTSAILNGRFQLASGATQYYADGTLLLKAPLTAINGLTPAADRIAYYTSASAGAMTALTSFGRSLIDDADAATARATLGLTTGTSAGNVVVLDGSAKLPAVDGSALTGVVASPYVADSWDFQWSAAAGSPATLANYTGSANISAVTIVGGGAFGGAAVTYETVSCWEFTPTAVSERQELTILPVTPADSWELRVRVWLPGEDATGTPQHVGALGKQVGTNTPQFLAGASITGACRQSGTAEEVKIETADIRQSWVTLTIRATTVFSGTTPSNWAQVAYQLWCGEFLVGTWNGANVTAGSVAAGLIRFGKSTGTGTRVMRIASLAWRSGNNAAPPSYTYRGKGFGGGGPA